MLVYEKKVNEGEELKRRLFGTMGNVPAEDDNELIYKDADDAVITPVQPDFYVDDKSGGIIRLSDNKAVKVFINDNMQGEVQIIPPVAKDSEVIVEDEKVIESITISAMPTKTTYIEAEALDLTGLEVTANYDDGTSEVVTDFKTTPVNSTVLTTADIKVVVTVGEAIAEFEITVAAKELTSIEFTKQPTKVEYTEGEALEVAGAVITAKYNNNTEEVVEAEFVPADGTVLTLTDTTLTASYEGKTTTTTLVINEALPTVEEALVNMSGFTYSPAYTYHGDVEVNGNNINYTIANEKVGEKYSNIMNDFARFLGALYRGNDGKVNPIAYAGTEYAWDKSGTLKGSNYKAANGDTLVSAVVNALAANIAAGSASLELSTLGEVITITATVTA